MIIYIIIALVCFYLGWAVSNNTRGHAMTDFYITDSKIAGKGIHCKVNLRKGEMMFIGISDKQVTPPAGMINHCNHPNTVLLKRGNNYYVFASKDIQKNTELTIDYNTTPVFILKPDPKWTC